MKRQQLLSILVTTFLSRPRTWQTRQGCSWSIWNYSSSFKWLCHDWLRPSFFRLFLNFEIASNAE
jgi:hypothetical protein